MSKAAELAALIGSQSSLSNRNLIINGAMQVAQRGTSFTGSSEYTLDRFYFNRLNTDQLACTITQDTDSPDGFYNSLKVEVTTAETTLDSDEFARVFSRFEGQNLQHLQYGTSSAKSLTLSFWVKASVTGDYAVLFYRDLTTDRSITKTYTVNSANTWEYKTITIDGDQTTATPSDNVSRFEIDWALAAGTDWTSTDGTSWGTYVSGKFAYGQTANLIGTANATWYITGVQLELGEQATPFEHRSFQDEITRCKRYYQKSFPYDTAPFNNRGQGGARWDERTAVRPPNSFSNATYIGAVCHLPVTMRATPVTTAYNTNTSGTSGSYLNDLQNSATTTSYAIQSTNHNTELLSFYAGGIASQGNTFGVNWEADAEL